MELFYILAHYFLIFKGVLLWLSHKGLSLKSSACHAGWLTLCMIYCVYKILFLCKLSSYTIYADLILDFIIIFVIRKYFRILDILKHIQSILKNIKTGHLVFILPLIYGLLLAIILSPTTYDVNTYHESRILLLEQKNTYFLNSFNNICEVMYGLGYDLVLHNHLRFGTDRGLAIYGYISFLCIIGFLYNFTDDNSKTKFKYFLPCLLFIGLIEPVYQSLSAKNDLPGALACLASFHAFSKWKNSRRNIYFLLSLASLIWAVACKKVYLAFALPMLVLWIVSLVKNPQFFKLSYRKVFLWGSLLLFISPIITYIYNFLLWENWSGPINFTNHHSNNSPILGSIGNFIRYSFEIMHLPHFIDLYLKSHFSFSPVDSLNQLWFSFFYPWIGNSGESDMPFMVEWEQLEDSWFGPIGTALFIFFIFQFFTEKIIKQKEILFAAFTYIFFICLMLSWRPHNDRYFSLFFIFCSLLPGIGNYKFFNNKKLKTIIFATSILLLNWSMFFNRNSPTFNFLSLNVASMLSDAWTNGVISRSNFGKNKLGFPDIPEDILKQLNLGSKIALWTDEFIPIPSLTKLAKFKLFPLNFEADQNYNVTETKEVPMKRLSQFEYLLHFGNPLTFSIEGKTPRVMWQSKHDDARAWTLIKIKS